MGLFSLGAVMAESVGGELLFRDSRRAHLPPILLEEGTVVDAIRQMQAKGYEIYDAVVTAGMIRFRPVLLTAITTILGLAPMAVLSRYQRRGIGSGLVEQGLKLLREQGCPFVIVLGHPEYYPRFGFIPASQRKITCQWNGVPREAFMVLVLDEDAMPKAGGEARYMEEFDTAI